MLLEQPRQQIPPRDLHLLLDSIAGDANNLESVAQRRRYVEQVVGRADEQCARQIERQVQVVIDEVMILRRIQHLQHGGRRIARCAATGHLVDLIDHQDRIPHAHAAEPLQQESGHRADVRAPVSTDFGFVPDATHGNPVERTPDRLGDRLA